MLPISPGPAPSATFRYVRTLAWLVRLVLSHVVHPVDGPAATADDIAWIAGRTHRQ